MYLMLNNLKRNSGGIAIFNEGVGCPRATFSLSQLLLPNRVAGEALQASFGFLSDLVLRPPRGANSSSRGTHGCDAGCVIVAGPFLSPLLTALAKRGVLNRQKGAFQTAAPKGQASQSGYLR